MEENKTLVAGATENVEKPTEETQVEKPVEKTYTQSQLDEIVGKRLARNSAKIRKEYESKFGDLESVLRVGTGKESVEEITDTLKKFYASKGIKLPEKPTYSDRDIEILAQAEANDIINSGFEDVVEEVDRLSRVGFENMTARDKAYFKVFNPEIAKEFNIYKNKKLLVEDRCDGRRVQQPRVSRLRRYV